MIGNGSVGLENKRTSGDHLNYSIVDDWLVGFMAYQPLYVI